MEERKQVIRKVVGLILQEMEEPHKGNLTTRYVIGVLQEAIDDLEANALMRPAQDYLKEES